jgi:hypothetical protein
MFPKRYLRPFSCTDGGAVVEVPVVVVGETGKSRIDPAAFYGLAGDYVRARPRSAPTPTGPGFLTCP